LIHFYKRVAAAAVARYFPRVDFFCSSVE